MENYIHPVALERVLDIRIEIGEHTDVPLEVARTFHNQSESEMPWENLSDNKKGEKIRNAKRRLNNDVAVQMTYEEILEADDYGEIKIWLAALKTLLTE